MIPLFKLYKIGKVISYEQASEIVGKHFPEIKDKLLNTLQLNNLTKSHNVSYELILVCIDQKATELSPFNFTVALNFSVNKKYFKFLLPPVLFFVFIIVASPSIITKSSKRIFNYSTLYSKQAPFSFQLLNKDLQTIQQQDYKLDVKLSGENIPNEAYIVINNNEYKLTKENTILFYYIIKNPQHDLKFFFRADGYNSKEFNLKVVPQPIIVDFEVKLSYPLYTKKSNETLQNPGDLSVPLGSKVTWKIRTKDTRKVLLRFDENRFYLDPVTPELFSYTQQIFTSQIYSISNQNQYITGKDSLKYSINAIPDGFPFIESAEYKDSIFENHIYFKGQIKDDYGFNKLLFKYKKISTNNISEEETIKNIPINKSANQEEFYFYFDISSLDILPGDNVEYYFEIWDNDGINGSKSARTQKIIFSVPTLDEIEKKTELNNEDLKQKIELVTKDANQLKKQVENLDYKLIDKKTINWQDRKQIEDLLNKQQQLQKNIDKLRDQLKENFIKENQYNKTDESIIEKQKQLEELFNNVMTDEMKELFKQLQELIEKLDKNKIEETLDKMKLGNKDIEKELDRNLELFKNLELEKKINESIDKLKNLSEEQKKLSVKTNEGNEDQKKLINDQNKINEKFNSIKNDLRDIEKKNQELDEPQKILNTTEKENLIQEELNNSQQNLQNKKMKNASKSQQKAGEQMEQVANDLQKHQDEMESEQMGEDIQALRMLLENLVNVSFEQEELMNKLKTTNLTDPKYVQLMDKQKKLNDDLNVIEDSLFALSKRQMAIQAVVNREIGLITENVKRCLVALHDRNTPSAQKWQQYIMTSVNNLALLLAESLEQMQQQAQTKSSKSGKGMKCNKPGTGKSSATSMRKLQEELNKKMQSLKKQMEEGKGKIGKTGKEGQSLNEQFSRLATEQEALRKLLQQYGEEMKKGGTNNNGNLSELMKNMEQTETELVNKLINSETLKRQQEILTRLLESEKAEKERDLDEKREAEKVKNDNYSNPNQFFEYKNIKSKEFELLKSIPVTLNQFYKYKANEYFFNFEN